MKRVTKRALARYPMIGSGKDGEIYRISNDKCVKYFFKEETKQKELAALQVGQASSIIPRLYEHGDNYIVMEFIMGQSLAQHMKHTGSIDTELTKKILFVRDEFIRLGFTRWDTEVRHILISEQGHLKVIDHKRAFTSDATVPTKLFKGMDKFGMLAAFLENVRRLRPELYEEWKDWID
ncbi:RIO-like serine/threonine protein kinase [Bacillus ectoiniformans]|nr:RIO-like serine/threonine protein kinase [Bacillus ectoiniformans]